VLSPADQDLGARALSNATFDPLAVHFTRPRVLPDGVERVATVSRGGTFDPGGHTTVRRDLRTGTALHPRYRRLVEASYKTPQLQEQEFRTALATLRVGERLVRDRSGVRRERVIPVRPPWLRRISDASTRALIERIRRQPIYLTGPPSTPVQVEEVLPDAAARMQERIRR